MVTNDLSVCFEASAGAPLVLFLFLFVRKTAILARSYFQLHFGSGHRSISFQLSFFGATGPGERVPSSASLTLPRDLINIRSLGKSRVLSGNVWKVRAVREMRKI